MKYQMSSKMKSTWIIYFFLLNAILISSLPAEVAVTVEDDDCIRRTTVARVLAGLTVIGLGAGIGYAITHADGKCHHHHSSSHHHSSGYHSYSNSSRCSNDFGCSSSSSDSSCSSHRISSHFPSSYYSSSDSSFFDDGNLANYIALPRHKIDMPRHSSYNEQSSTELCGVITANPTYQGYGSFTVYIHLPDGTQRTLGSLPFSGNGHATLTFGPFKQKGNYTWGISVDEGTVLPSQSKVSSLSIQVDGSTVDSYDFFLPAYPHAHYEPTAYSYSLM